MKGIFAKLINIINELIENRILDFLLSHENII